MAAPAKMGPALSKLLDIASPALGAYCQSLPSPLVELAGPLALELLEMLQARNGFYAFESALHVLHVGPSSAERGLEDWNSESLWRADYAGMADGCLFFAEDAFGFQFCIFQSAVHIFDPETAKKKPLASNLDGWAQAILDDYRVLTGWPLVHEWQATNGPIPPGTRLSPYPPFVMGGEYKAEAVRAIDAVEMMRFRADILAQIKDLPDGSKVRIRTKEKH